MCSYVPEASTVLHFCSIRLSYISSLFKTPAWFDSWQTHLPVQVQVKWCLQNTCWSSDIVFAVRPLCGEEQHDRVSSRCSIYLTGCWLIEVSVLREAWASFPTPICPLIFIISSNLCYEEQTLLVNRPFLDRSRASAITMSCLTRLRECKDSVSLKWSKSSHCVNVNHEQVQLCVCYHIATTKHWRD